jgi:hypothetical protein
MPDQFLRSSNPCHPIFASRPARALFVLQDGGLKPEAIQVIVAAAGGPKWLIPAMRTASFSAVGSPAAGRRST